MLLNEGGVDAWNGGVLTGAEPMLDWTVYRITGDLLKQLAD